MRFSKPSEVMGVALDPKAEDSLFVVTIHGHLYRWLLVAKAGGERHALTCPNLIDKGTARAVCLATPQESTTTYVGRLCSLLGSVRSGTSVCLDSCERLKHSLCRAATEDSADAKWPRMAVAVGLEVQFASMPSMHRVGRKLSRSSLFRPLSYCQSGVTNSNLRLSAPQNGSVQIVDMRNGMLLREVCVQDTAVLRVVWAYPSTVFTISTEPGPANTYVSRPSCDRAAYHSQVRVAC